MTLIVPAILDKTPEEFEKHINQLETSPSFQEGWVHIDFADNQFVPNQTILPDEVIYPEGLKKEAHLMVKEPLNWIRSLKEAGFDRVIFHFEAGDDISEIIQSINDAHMEIGIAINPETSIDWLESYKDEIDQILVMGIIPGFQGQPFIPATIDKIKALKDKGWPIQISVDGAVRDTNAKQLVEAGADQLVSGSFILQGDIEENIEKLWEAVNS